MKQLYTLLIAFLFVFSNTNAQTVVTSDPTAAWGSYMNVFTVSSGAKGDYAFGNGWSLANLKTTITDAGDTTYANGAITLQPNFNGYLENADDPFWRDNNGAGPGGNAWMEATTKVEYAAGTFTDTSLSFVGTVNSNDLDSGYTAVAFIKTLDPNNNYNPVINETVALGADGTTFSVSASGINPAHVVQYGFTVEGINANPTNETALGSVVVTPFTSGFEEPDYTPVTVDVSQAWKGYVSWFKKNPDGSKGDYVSGDEWTDLNDVKTTLYSVGDESYADGAIGLQPNFNLYEDAAGDATEEAYWRDGDEGNKHLEASSFVEYAAGEFTDGALTFVGNVDINAINAGYEVIAFIKTINATNFQPVITKTVELGATGTSFEVKAAGINAADKVQYGFTVMGLNANPNNEGFLSGVVVTPDVTVLSVTDELEAIGFTVYPNPVQNTLNVSAGVVVDAVSIFDLTGREVMRATPNAAAFSLDVNNLNKGMYLVTVKAGEQELTTKLVK